MSRINPLYIGAFLVLLLLFFSVKLQGVKDELKDAKEQYKITMQVAEKLNDLKKIYNNKKKDKRMLANLLKNRALQSANIETSDKKSSMLISSKSIDLTALNALMSKVLNSTYKIKSIQIKKLSNEKASLDMEITW